MPRLRILILPLLSALIAPAFGETASSSCESWNASYCDAQFAQTRNAEIDASIMAMRMTRVQPANRSACDSADKSLSPCEGEVAANFANERNGEINASIAVVQVERDRRFAAARNAEVEASILTVQAARESEFALRRTSCESPDANLPPCEGEVAANFAAERNAENNASIAAVQVERDRRFAATRNAEVEASILTVQAARESEFALGRTSCESPDANLPPCEGEVAANFAKARNAEIDLSIAAVAIERERRFAQARNAEITASIAAVKVARERDYAEARSAMALAWLHAIRDDRTQRFAAARNGEINASIAAVKAARERDFAQSLTHCKTVNSQAPRCEAEPGREFAAARNAEASASLAAVQAARDRNFAQARNAEFTASIATVETARARTAALSTTHCTGMGEPSPQCEAEHARELAMSMTHCKPGASKSPRCEVERTREFAAARNAEINTSIALANAAHDRLFAETRNAEINASIAAVETERAIRSAQAQRQSPSIETGAIRVPEVPVEPVLPLRRSINAEPCAAAGIRLTPVQFSGPGATVDDAMKPGLDTIAAIAKDCPAVHIEIHGYSDSLSAVQVSRLLSEMRAKAVMGYLESAGVDAARMVAIGHGDMIPLAANTTEENRAQNRRVEFTIKDPMLQAGVKRVMWDLSELLDPAYVPQLARLSP
jgi:outer membrane protein OmpA-like peptidoglycan-associated protein